MGTVVSVARVPLSAPARPGPPERVSDEGLVERVRAGDERAFEELYARYRNRLHRYCASILRQPEDAEEAVQSAMLGAYRALAGGEVRAVAVRPWLYRIAHNQCIGMLRRRAARPTEPLTGLEVQHSQDVAARVETADELVRLRQDLQSLPADQRGALVLRELSGLSHEQIALVLDESPSTVKQLIYQARLGLHAMADGRALGCDTVRRRISDGDGRVLRSRGMGAHLRTCPTCRAFREGLATRPAKLAALVPVAPVVLGRDILGALGGGGAAGGAGVGATGVGAVGGFSLAGGIALKLALVATVGIIGASAVVVPRVIGEPARSGPAAATAHRHAVPALQAATGPIPVAATLTAADPPEVDAPPPVFEFVPPVDPPAQPPPAPQAAGGAVPAASTVATLPPPDPAAAVAGGGAPAAGGTTTPQRAGGAGGTPATQRNGAPPAHARGGPDAEAAPGNSASAPGRSGDAPGDSGSAPGNSGSAPGRSGGAPPAATPAAPATPATPAEPATPASAGGVHGASADAPGQAVAEGAKGPKGPPDR